VEGAYGLRDELAEPGAYRDAMGYNPYRKRVSRSSDVWFVVAAVVVVLAAVAWAAL
jgi:hypothetical protein